MHAVRYAVLALVALPVVSSRPAWSLIGPPAPPFVAAATADAVVIGTVSHVEPDPVTITFPPIRKGQEERKWSYRVAVVDIESDLAGTVYRNRLRVGLPIPPPDTPNVGKPDFRGRINWPALRAGERRCLILRKLPPEGHYAIWYDGIPIDPKAGKDKARLDKVKQALAVIDDPLAGLGAKAAADRYFAANVLLRKYNRYRWSNHLPTERAPLSAEESRLIIRAIREQEDWSRAEPGLMPATHLIVDLGMTAADGWVWPKGREPGADPGTAAKAAFEEWADGPGADFVIHKTVLKPK
jgi:hypothetical protein